MNHDTTQAGPLTITLYKWYGEWVFDDERVGLVKEGLINGTDRIIDEMVKNIPNASAGVDFLFWHHPFPHYDVKLTWWSVEDSEVGGNWYYCEKYDIHGWLCPSLYLYFPDAPLELYVKAVQRDNL